MPLLEVIALDLTDARNAADGGADRLELCSEMAADGLTPSPAVVETICGAGLPLKVMAMIRPRGGDFVYSAGEVETMAQEIRLFQQLGVDGVVLGCLTRSDESDIEALRRLLDVAEGLSVTCHRAFDSISNRAKAIETLASLGVERVLTLGFPCGAARQPTNVPRLLDTARLAEGRLTIMTGGWLEGNAEMKLIRGGVREFHFGRAMRGEGGYASPVDPHLVREWKRRLTLAENGEATAPA